MIIVCFLSILKRKGKKLETKHSLNRTVEIRFDYEYDCIPC
jgi:hypothetical protein